MPSARFDHSGGSVVFSRAPQRAPGGLELLQAEARSTGGVRFGLDPHAVERRLSLRWSGLSTTDRAALETFFATTAQGMAEVFTYTDVNGTAHVVRFAAATLDFTEIAYGRHDVTVDLLEVA